MKRNILILATIILISATSAFSMPAATSDYFGKAEDSKTTLMATYYEEGTGFAVDAGITIPVGTLWGFGVYYLPSIQAGEDAIQGNAVDLAFLYGIGSGWYLGPIITPVNIDWPTDIANQTGNPLTYIKAAVGGCVGVSTGKIGIGIGGKRTIPYDSGANHVDAKWQGGLYLTVNF